MMGKPEMDYRVFGVTRENDRQQLDEAVEIILGAWSNERVSRRELFGNMQIALTRAKTQKAPRKYEIFFTFRRAALPRPGGETFPSSPSLRIGGRSLW